MNRVRDGALEPGEIQKSIKNYEKLKTLIKYIENWEPQTSKIRWVHSSMSFWLSKNIPIFYTLETDSKLCTICTFSQWNIKQYWKKKNSNKQNDTFAKGKQNCAGNSNKKLHKFLEQNWKTNQKDGLNLVWHCFSTSKAINLLKGLSNQ